ncbi:MAG: hypothetical protein ACRDS9_00870 [Pseudonocardiaceae bacterium]
MSKRSDPIRLEPGQDSILNCEPIWHEEDGAYWLDWRFKPLDGSKTLSRRTKAPTKGEVRRKANAKAKELRTTGGAGIWKPSNSLGTYVKQVTRPAIETAQLAENSRARYLLVLKWIEGDCDHHNHRYSIKNHTIASGIRFRPLEACLKEIAELHGMETAHQARSVLGKYVIQQLERDELINGSPIAGKRLDLGAQDGDDDKVSRGGDALSREEWRSVLDYLLDLDPADGVEPPKRGRYTLEDRIDVRRNAIELALLQATTGLRVGEATSVEWPNVEVDDITTIVSNDGNLQVVIGDDGIMSIFVGHAITKTKRGRGLPVIDGDGRVITRLLERRHRLGESTGLVIGSPAMPDRPWAKRQRDEATAKLYKELADKLDIELLRTARSHVWRATLNTLLVSLVPEEIRRIHFGHTAAVNRQHYLDRADTTVLIDAARTLRAS